MATLYNVYNGDTSEYALKLINTPISDDKETSIYLGDEYTRIYTKESGSIIFGANINIAENLTIGSSLSLKKLTVYGSTSTNVENPYTNVTSHIRQSAVSNSLSFTTSDILLLEGNSGSFLQLLSNGSSISGIGFSDPTNRNVSSIEYTNSSSNLNIKANNMSFTPVNTNGSSNSNANIISINSLGEMLSDVNYNTVDSVSGSSNIIANFTRHSVVIAKPTSANTSITLNAPFINTTPHRMRILYLLVKSNGSYSLSTLTSQGGKVNLPSDFAVYPSSSGKYDLYSFLSNGQDLFCTFAYNYTPISGGTLNTF